MAFRLDIPLSEIGQYTPRLLQIRAREISRRRQEDREWLETRLAWVIAHVINPWVKGKVTVNQILGRPSNQLGDAQTTKEYFRRKRERMERKYGD